MQAKYPHILNEEHKPKQKSTVSFHNLANDWPRQLSQFHLFSRLDNCWMTLWFRHESISYAIIHAHRQKLKTKRKECENRTRIK